MARTKATVRRMSLAAIPQQRIGNKNILNRRLRNILFKLKNIMPEMKNGQVIKEMNVRRKATYFSGKRRLNI